jgi:hypothetical protein
MALSAPIQGYPSGFKVLRADSTLSGTNQGYPGKFNGIQLDSSLLALS